MSGFLSSMLRSKVVATTYDLTTASGSQSITGFGFQPTAVIVYGNVFGTSSWSVGMCDSSNTQAYVSGVSDATTPISGTGFTLNHTNGALTARQAGAVTMAADGISISWTKTGAPTGTLQILVLGIR